MTPYDRLQIPVDADKDDIRKAYRRWSMKWHPDRRMHLSEEDRGRADDEFRQIQRAQDQLLDDQRREELDLTLEGTAAHAGLLAELRRRVIEAMIQVTEDPRQHGTDPVAVARHQVWSEYVATCRTMNAIGRISLAGVTPEGVIRHRILSSPARAIGAPPDLEEIGRLLAYHGRNRTRLEALHGLVEQLMWVRPPMSPTPPAKLPGRALGGEI